MDIDPRLRDTSQRVADAYAHAPAQSLSSYTLNPIHLPPPQQHNPGLPSLTQDVGHPYYSVQQDSRPQHVPTSVPEPQTRSELANTLRPQQPSDRKDDPKRPRACEACRGLKVRCVPDPAKGTCRRCAKAGRSCIVTVPSRKRQKKTDSRVAELEKKIDALTASLQATKNQTMSGSDGESSEGDYVQEEPESTNVSGIDTPISGRKGNGPWLQQPEQSPMVSSTASKNGRKRKRADQENVWKPTKTSTKHDLETKTFLNEYNAPNYTRSHLLPKSVTKATSVTSFDPSLPGHEYADVVDRKILDSETAAKMFNHYTGKMAPHMPVVVFNPGTGAGEIRRTQPALFLAILSVAAGYEHPDLQPILFRELTHVYADRIFVRGEKSMELIQALQISSMWYSPEEHKDSRPYQFVHMAAIMAMGMGLGRPFKLTTGFALTLWKDNRKPNDATADAGSTVSNRAWLGCYLLSGITAANTRQPNLLPWNPHIEVCIQNLENAKDSLPSDKLLIQWVKLRHLTDQIFASFKLEDFGISSIINPDMEESVHRFEKKLDEWKDQLPAGLKSLSLTIAFCFINMYVKHTRIRLYYADECIDEPQRPAKSAGNKLEHLQAPTSVQVGAMQNCLEAIYEVFDNFLSLTADDIRTIPGFHFVRMAYTVVFQLRLYSNVLTPECRITKLMPPSLMRVESYLNRLLDLLQQAATNDRSRPARNFHLALRMLKGWYERLKDNRHRANGGGFRGPKLDIQAQPIDTESSTPHLGYRKLSVHNDRPMESLSPPPVRKARSSSMPQPNVQANPPPPPPLPLQLSQPPLHLSSHPDQTSQNQQQAHHLHHHQLQPPHPQLNNTPLHLLSQLATNDASTTHHQLSTTPTPHTGPWYPPHAPTLASNGHTPSSLPSMAAHHPHTYPPPTLPSQHPYPTDHHANYHSETHTYYPTAHSYPDPNAYSNGGYQSLPINPGLEQAMGMAFGEEADLAGLFMDDGVFQMMQQSHGGGSMGGYGWEGGAG